MEIRLGNSIKNEENKGNLETNEARNECAEPEREDSLNEKEAVKVEGNDIKMKKDEDYGRDDSDFDAKVTEKNENLRIGEESVHVTEKDMMLEKETTNDLKGEMGTEDNVPVVSKVKQITERFGGMVSSSHRRNGSGIPSVNYKSKNSVKTTYTSGKDTGIPTYTSKIPRVKANEAAVKEVKKEESITSEQDTSARIERVNEQNGEDIVQVVSESVEGNETHENDYKDGNIVVDNVKDSETEITSSIDGSQVKSLETNVYNDFVISDLQEETKCQSISQDITVAKEPDGVKGSGEFMKNLEVEENSVSSGILPPTEVATSQKELEIESQCVLNDDIEEKDVDKLKSVQDTADITESIRSSSRNSAETDAFHDAQADYPSENVTEAYDETSHNVLNTTDENQAIELDSDDIQTAGEERRSIIGVESTVDKNEGIVITNEAIKISISTLDESRLSLKDALEEESEDIHEPEQSISSELDLQTSASPVSSATDMQKATSTNKSHTAAESSTFGLESANDIVENENLSKDTQSSDLDIEDIDTKVEIKEESESTQNNGSENGIKCVEIANEEMQTIPQDSSKTVENNEKIEPPQASLEVVLPVKEKIYDQAEEDVNEAAIAVVKDSQNDKDLDISNELASRDSTIQTPSIVPISSQEPTDNSTLVANEAEDEANKESDKPRSSATFIPSEGKGANRQSMMEEKSIMTSDSPEKELKDIPDRTTIACTPNDDLSADESSRCLVRRSKHKSGFLLWMKTFPKQIFRKIKFKKRNSI